MNTEAHKARARILFRKPPADVFDAFVDGRKMRQFWFHRRDDRLVAGQTSTWALGTDDDAFAFDVRVIELVDNERIAIEWPAQDDRFNVVEWSFTATDDGDTLLSIEESGFRGNDESVVAALLDSTGGFNQVIVAAKAFVEHGVAINVVQDHA